MLLGLLACAPEPPAGAGDTGWDFPAVDALPESADPPDPFVSWSTGERVEDVAGWEETRRPELRALFDHYLYGVPAAPVAVALTGARDATLADGTALRELTLDVDGLVLHLALFLPPGVDDPPLLLGLDKCGNASITADPAVTVVDAWLHPDCTGARGERADEWPLAVALDAGWAVAALHESELDPDDPDAADRAQATFAGGDPPWATLSTWAWGLSRALDGLLADGRVDPDRVVVFGHSRRGKTALLAGARDPRFAGVWAHQSGTGGASLSRSLDGESIAAITTLFPHWFVPAFAGFAGHEARLPVDQHLLLALVAPRPLLVSDGADDTWADPAGAAWAVELATPVWTLYGAAAPTWTERAGGHAIGAEDWAGAVAWADAHVPGGSP